MYRIGIGQDSHKLKSKNKKIKKSLILGGVEIGQGYYLEADSDGDVIIHALCNALDTAIGYGSFDLYAGSMSKQGISDSKEYLKVALEMVRKKGYKINNISFMIETKRPKLEDHREEICQSLARLLGLGRERIGMAFTTGEDLTSFGEGKGMQAFCVVSLIKWEK